MEGIRLQQLMVEQVKDNTNKIYPEVISPSVPRIYKRDRKLRKARQKMVRYAKDEGYSFGDISTILGLSKEHISRIYKETVGNNVDYFA